MGVNIASLLHGWRIGLRSQWFPILLSLGGFITCLMLWINLGALARVVGTVWACAGVLLWIVRRRITVLP